VAERRFRNEREAVVRPVMAVAKTRVQNPTFLCNLWPYSGSCCNA
jgi:hypothetical protein